MTDKTPRYHYEFTLNAFLSLGERQVILSGTIKDSEEEGKESGKKEIILSASLGTLSLKQIIEDIIHLVRPTYQLNLPFPWDKILSVELQNVVLSYNTEKKAIGFETDFKFGVPGLLDLRRVYIDAKSVHEVGIKFDGTVFGDNFDQKGWNLVGADGPPTPPPQKDLLFQLNFLGLGQRLRLKNASEYKHVSDAITDMESLFDPPKEGTLVPRFENSLVFDNDSNWLFGLDAEIMGTVDLSIVFNDPVLYGLFISLKGEKAKSLAGLQFEILYKKITDDIGVYQIELVLPAYIRSMEFGAVSVTLPQIGVDIYTNGNFKTDFGFPRDLDFSSSFAVQVFPFVGFGGFYFAVLNGATSSRLPVSSNGTFNPVLEFGIGLQLGVGKVIDKGILQATAIITFIGVVEGTLAWFNLNKPSSIPEKYESFYYRLSGTFAIVGRISGTVNFAIISATLDMTVYAAATVVIEACEPIELSFIAGVSVSLRFSINCGLFTIHIRLSFSTSISYQFKIGNSNEKAQWKALPSVGTKALDIENGSHSAVLERLDEHAAHQSIPLDWRHNFEQDEPELIEIYYLTQFTATADDKNEQSAAIAMLFARYSNNPGKQSISDSKINSHNFRELLPFEQIAVAAFCWALNAAKETPINTLADLFDSNVTAVKLANILFTLEQTQKSREVPFTDGQLSKFIHSLFILNIIDPYDKDVIEELRKEPGLEYEDKNPLLHLALFPMIPGLTLQALGMDEIVFSTHNQVSENYRATIDELINRFSVELPEDKRKPGFESEGEPEPESQSLATLLFRDYFLLLIKSLLQSARDALESYHHNISEGETLYSITQKYSPAESDANPADVISVGITNAISDTILKEGAEMHVSGTQYVIQKDDTLASIFEKFGLLKSADSISDMLRKQIITLSGAKPIFITGEKIDVRNVSQVEDDYKDYVIKEGDTLNSIIENKKLDEAQTTLLLNANLNTKGILVTGETVTISTDDHVIDEGDTFSRILKKYGLLKEGEAVGKIRLDQVYEYNIDKKIFTEDKVINVGGKTHKLTVDDTLSSVLQVFDLNEIKDEPGILQADKIITLPIDIRIEEDDTLATVLKRYSRLNGAEPLLKDAESIKDSLRKQLLVFNGDKELFIVDKNIDINGAPYRFKKNDSLNSIINDFDLNDHHTGLWLNSIKDKSAILNPGEILIIPAAHYSVVSGDTIATVLEKEKYDFDIPGSISEDSVRLIVELNGDKAIFKKTDGNNESDRKLTESDTYYSMLRSEKIFSLIKNIKDEPDTLNAGKILTVEKIKHPVETNDTLAQIVKKYNLELTGDEIQKERQVKNLVKQLLFDKNKNRKLFLSAQITIDGEEQVVLKEGDSFKSIIDRYGLDDAKIMSLIDAIYKRPETLIPKANIDVRVLYKIEEGDTLAGILEKHGRIKQKKSISHEFANDFFELNLHEKIFIQEGVTLDSMFLRFRLEESTIDRLLDELKNARLKKFKQILLPRIKHNVNKNETLLSIANVYNIALSDLILENQRNDILQTDETMIVEHACHLPVDELLHNMYLNDAFGHAAGTASRFFMSGLRLPNKICKDKEQNDAGTSSLYNLTGQQFVFNLQKESGKPVQNEVILTKTPARNTSEELKWVIFNGQIDDSAQDSRQSAQLVHKFEKNGDKAKAIELRTAENYQQFIAAFSPEIILGPVTIKLYNDQLKTFPFSNPILWQREASTDSKTDNNKSSITPYIWRFPPGLRTARHKKPELSMVIGTQPRKDVALQKLYLEEAEFNWSTLLPITIRKIPQDGSSNEITNNTYEVYGTDAAGIELLTDLVKLVNLNKGVIENTQILFPSNPQENETEGLQSYNEFCTTLLINTNLSTESNPDTLTTNASDGSGTPGTTAEEMIKRLWKASLVRTGGFYLYIKSRDGDGIPDTLFNDDQLAEIFLLINYQKSKQITPYMNSVTINHFIDTQQSVLFAEWLVGTDEDEKIIEPETRLKEGKIVRVPAILPGHAGFKIERKNPHVRYSDGAGRLVPSKMFEYQFETQYDLLDFTIKEGGIFKETGEGLAVGPEKDYCPKDATKSQPDEETDDLTASWKYKRVFPLIKLVKKEHRSPSRYIGLNQSLTMEFGWRDNYGNQVKQPDFILDFKIKYFDYLIALSQWPHFYVNYEFVKTENNKGNIQINFHFNPGDEYVPKTDNTESGYDAESIIGLKDKVESDLDLYQKALDQIQQKDVQFSYTVSMSKQYIKKNGTMIPSFSSYPQTKNKAGKLKDAIGCQLTVIVSKLSALFAILKTISEEIEDKINMQETVKNHTIPLITEKLYEWTEEITEPFNPDDIFPLEIILRIARDKKLVDKAFVHVPEVQTVNTIIKPKTESKAILSIADNDKVLVDELNKKILPEKLRDELKSLEVNGLQNIDWGEEEPFKITVKQEGREWRLNAAGQTYTIREDKREINIYRSGAGYRAMADVFQNLYPGMKLCTAYTKGKQQQELWVVRISSNTNHDGIGYSIKYKQAAFYAPQPLSTHLVTLENVPIYPYAEYKVAPTQKDLKRKSFSMIDPEVWAIDYLEAMETILSPEYSIPITMLDHYLDNKNENAFLRRMLNAKHKVAEAIAYQTIPILKDLDEKGLGVAREKLKQQLLINLLDGYKTNAIVQYNADIVSKYPDVSNPLFEVAPNLYGQPYVIIDEKSPSKIKDNDDDANFSLSTGKVALNGTDKDKQKSNNSFLTYLFNTQTENYQSEISLKIDYKVNHLEYDIRKLGDKVDQTDVDDIKNYSVSKWLSFIKPFSDSKDIITPVPIPIRSYPKLPDWVSQQFNAEIQKKDDVLNIEQAKKIDYEFSYVLPQYVAQDRQHLEVLFNCKNINKYVEDEERLARSTLLSKNNYDMIKLDRLLHESLAQFNEAKELIFNDLKYLLPQFNADNSKQSNLVKLLDSYCTLVNSVATSWHDRFNPNKASGQSGSEPDVVAVNFVLEEGFMESEDNNKKPGRFQIVMTDWLATEGPEKKKIDYISKPVVTIEKYHTEVKHIEKENKVVFYFFNEEKPGGKKYLEFDGEDEAVPPLARTIKFDYLDVLLLQNAWPGLHVERNANLSSDKEKKTSDEFIYKTPMSRFVNPLTPLVERSNELDISSLIQQSEPDLTTVLAALLNELLSVKPQNKIRPTTLKIILSYSYRNIEKTGPEIMLPCFLIPPKEINDTNKDAEIKSLANAITNWFEKHQPVLTDGKLHFDTTFYSLLADNDLPILRLSGLFLEVDKINTFSQMSYAEA